MKVLTLIYIIAYFLHILFGPYFLTYLVMLKKPKWMSKNINDVLRRCIFITYLSFLTIAYFNQYPNTETFLVSFIVSATATLGYYLKFYSSEVFYMGLFDHIVYLLIPLIYLFFYYEISFYNYSPSLYSFICLIYIFTITYYDQNIYIGGVDM